MWGGWVVWMCEQGACMSRCVSRHVCVGGSVCGLGLCAEGAVGWGCMQGRSARKKGGCLFEAFVHAFVRKDMCASERGAREGGEQSPYHP